MLAAGHRVRTHPVHPVQGLEGAEVFDLRDHLVEPLDGGQTFQETAPGELLAPGGAQPSREGQGRVGQEPPHGAGPGPAKGGGVCQTTLPKVAETVVDQGGAEVGEGGEIAGSGQRQLRKPVEPPGVALRQPGGSFRMKLRRLIPGAGPAGCRRARATSATAFSYVFPAISSTLLPHIGSCPRRGAKAASARPSRLGRQLCRRSPGSGDPATVIRGCGKGLSGDAVRTGQTSRSCRGGSR